MAIAALTASSLQLFNSDKTGHGRLENEDSTPGAHAARYRESRTEIMTFAGMRYGSHALWGNGVGNEGIDVNVVKDVGIVYTYS